MTQTLQGTIRGKTIILSDDPGMADGQKVEVSLRTISPGAEVNPGEGLLRSEGALKDDPHWDRIMETVYQERKRERGLPQADV